VISRGRACEAVDKQQRRALPFVQIRDFKAIPDSLLQSCHGYLPYILNVP
jgi:hypothetical protein